jgi:hypothetical protein
MNAAGGNISCSVQVGRFIATSSLTLRYDGQTEAATLKRGNLDAT